MLALFSIFVFSSDIISVFGAAADSFCPINVKELPDVPLDQPRHLRLALRLPVAEIKPHGNRQAQLRRHDLRVGLGELPPANEKPHKPGEIAHNVRVVPFGLHACHLPIAELLNGQHLSCTADLRIVQDVSDLPEAELHRHIRCHVFLVLCEGRVIPILFCKNGNFSFVKKKKSIRKN